MALSGSTPDGDPSTMVAIDGDQAIRLLAAAGYGRVVFTRDGLPAIRPVNHLVEDDGTIILHTRLTSRLTSAVRADPEVVVAYEVDDIDPIRRTGWSVVVTGLARTITDPDRIAHYEKLLRPWVDEVMNALIEIRPSVIAGVQLFAVAGE